MTYRELLAYVDAVGTEPRLTTNELVHAYELIRRIGPTNCWTGTTGGLASAVRSLIVEVVRLRRERDDTAKAIRWVTECVQPDAFGAIWALERHVANMEREHAC